MLRLRRVTATADQWQAADADGAVLAGESQRVIATLLLRNAADLVVERVVDRGLAIDFDRQSARTGKDGVTDIVLPAAG